MGKIRIFLSDPQVLFREGIHFTLSGEEDFEVTGEATSNEDALANIESYEPDIAVLSMHNGKLTGQAATRRIKRRFPAVSVVLIIDSNNEEQTFSAIKAGASACLTKDTQPETLVDVIRAVARSEQPIVEAMLIPEIASRVLTEFNNLAAFSEQLNDFLARLAPRESEILNSIAAGDGLEQVTGKLNIDEETVRQSLRQVINKMIANDQARSVIEAAQRSLPSIISDTIKMKEMSEEYITRKEFNTFKDTLMQRLKNFIGEIIPQ